MEIMKRETRTLKWYLKDIVKTAITEPTDWLLVTYITIVMFGVCTGVGLAKILIFLINNLVGV